MNDRERSELVLGFFCHVIARLLLGFRGFSALVRFSNLSLPFTRRPLSPSQLRRIAMVSRRIARGSCLTESVVLKLLARRHGRATPALTIGVTLQGGFRAHAWTAFDDPQGGYIPLWVESFESTPSPSVT